VTKFASASPATSMNQFTLHSGNLSAIDGSGDLWITSNVGPSFSVLKYTNSGAANGQIYYSMNDPTGIAFDSTGDAWVADTGSDLLIKSSNLGAVSLTIGMGFQPFYVAIDGAENAWIPGNTLNSVVEVSNSGALLSPATGFTGSGWVGTTGIAIDGSGNIWMTGNGVAEIIGAATPVITPIAAGLPTTPTSNGSSNLGTRP